MTEERANEIIKAIEEFKNQEELLALSPEDAVKALNDSGNDFTVEEIIEIGEALQTVGKRSGSDELNADALENVAGGMSIRAYMALCAVQSACTTGMILCAHAALCAW